MKLVLAEPRLLKESVSIISELVNEVTFVVDSNAIELKAMDPAKVSMIVFKLLSSAFVEYEVENETKISVSLEGLNQILKRAKPSDTLHLEMDNKKNQLIIKLKGESSRTFKLTLLDYDEKEHTLPNLKFGAKIEMPSSVFYEAIDDMGVVAESVAFKSDKTQFVIEAESKLNSAIVKVTGNDETTIECGDDVVSKYSLEYLKKIVKGSKLAENVVIQFGNEYPLRADFKVMDKLSMMFILAPRVIDE
ncbi:MAG: proliferating cell nuclear antigen (pcna) [Nanoarchaeota archaeon]